MNFEAKLKRSLVSVMTINKLLDLMVFFGVVDKLAIKKSRQDDTKQAYLIRISGLSFSQVFARLISAGFWVFVYCVCWLVGLFV